MEGVKAGPAVPAVPGRCRSFALFHVSCTSPRFPLQIKVKGDEKGVRPTCAAKLDH